MLLDLEELGLYELKVQEQVLRELTQAELVSNNVNTKQVCYMEAGGDEIAAKVIRVCSTQCCGAGRRELPGHKSEAWTAEWLFTPLPTLVGAGRAPGKPDPEARSWYLHISDWLLRFTAFVLARANKFSMDRWVLDRLYHKDLGFLFIQPPRCLLQGLGLRSPRRAPLEFCPESVKDRRQGLT